MDIAGPRGYHIESVRLASGILGRGRGLIGSRPTPLLIPTGSVHGFHLAAELAVVAIDRAGQVLAVRRLRPWRMIRVRRARWMLELPSRYPVPRVGDRLQLLARDGEPDG